MTSATSSRGGALTAIGATIVGVTSVMKVLVPSLDLLSGMHFFADQVIFVGLFFFLLGLLITKKTFSPAPALYLFGAFVLYEMCRGFFSVASPATGRGMELFACLSVMLVVSYYASLGQRGMKLMLGILAGLAATVAVVAMGQFFVSLPEIRANPDLYLNLVQEIDRADFIDRLNTKEAFGPFTISNALGAFSLLMLFTFALASFLHGFSRKSIACIAIALVGIVTLALSMSKGGFLAAGVGIAAGVYFVLRLRGSSVAKAIIIPAIMLIVGGLSLVMLVAYGPEEAGRASAHVRLQYWQATTEIIGKSPIVGAGSGTFRDVYYTYKTPEGGETRHAHCDYLEIAAEDGIVGLLLFIIAVASLFVRRRTAKTHEDLGGKPALIPIVAAGVVWVGLLSAVVFSGAVDYDNILAHASSGSPVWVVLLVLTLFSGPIAAFFTARYVSADDRATSWIRAGAAVALIAFLVHSAIDFNFYNEGATLAFFGVAGLLVVTRHNGGNRVLLAIALVFALLFSYVSSELSRTRDTISTLDSYVNAIGSGESKLDKETLSKLADNMAVLPPRLLDDSESYAMRGELCELLARSLADFSKLSEQHYRTAILLNPNRYSYYRSLGEILLKTDSTAEGLTNLRLSVELYPSNADLLSEYITALLDAGRIEESREEYAKLVKLLDYTLPARAMPTRETLERIERRVKNGGLEPPGAK